MQTFNVLLGAAQTATLCCFDPSAWSYLDRPKVSLCTNSDCVLTLVNLYYANECIMAVALPAVVAAAGCRCTC